MVAGFRFSSFMTTTGATPGRADALAVVADPDSPPDPFSRREEGHEAPRSTTKQHLCSSSHTSVAQPPRQPSAEARPLSADTAGDVRALRCGLRAPFAPAAVRSAPSSTPCHLHPPAPVRAGGMPFARTADSTSHGLGSTLSMAPIAPLAPAPCAPLPASRGSSLLRVARAPCAAGQPCSSAFSARSLPWGPSQSCPVSRG